MSCHAFAGDAQAAKHYHINMNEGGAQRNGRLHQRRVQRIGGPEEAGIRPLRVGETPDRCIHFVVEGSSCAMPFV